MGAWQPLPDGLPPEVRHFVEQLRLLKDRTGLSLIALGARTAYSKSSWQRYLNATQPPPRQAVAALCRVAGLADADAERHAVRWEMAVQVWPRPAPAPARSAGCQETGECEGYDVSEEREAYEDAPTVPWWERLEEQPRPGPAGRLLLYAVLLLVALLFTAVAGAVALG
jgi:hypothetical protein